MKQRSAVPVNNAEHVRAAGPGRAFARTQVKSWQGRIVSSQKQFDRTKACSGNDGGTRNREYPRPDDPARHAPLDARQALRGAHADDRSRNRVCRGDWDP